jgi:putative PIN family toxin of toxin-antitoxin system
MDTNVLVSALKSKKGASHLFLKEFLVGNIDIVLSLPVYREYWEVTERESLVLNRESRTQVLRALIKFSRPTDIHFKWRPFLPDESDNMVLELAIAANADIVTHNKKDFEGVQEKFNVRILSPKEAIDECR